MENRLLTADEIFEKTMKTIAYLPSQESYARQLASIFAFHLRKNALIDAGFNIDSLPYQGGLIVSKTGTGKTFVLKSMAKLLNINLITLDGSSISRNGWKGATLSQQLLAAKNDAADNKSFLTSVLFIDEIDKMKLYGTEHDQGNAMDNLLALYNNGKIAVENGGREAEFIDTSRFTILLSGAFDGLEDIIASRLYNPKDVIFGKKKLDKNIIKYAIVEDLVNYGFKRELIGRISSIITIDPMEFEDYRSLLTSEKASLQHKYQTYFSFGCGVSFEITDSAVEIIANQCIDSETGARAINPIVNDILRGAIAMVDRDLSINKVILDSDVTGIYVDYKHGKRTKSVLKNDLLPDTPYYLTAKSVYSLVGQLCSLYNRAKCEPEYFEEFKVFTHLGLLFLNTETRPEDFSYDSLQKLAKTIYKPYKSSESTFDIMIDDVLKLPVHHPEIEPLYEEFKQYWDSDSTYRINRALTLILDKLGKLYGSSNIKFRIGNTK